MTFPRDQRLNDRRLLDTVFRQGVKKKTPFFQVLLFPSPSEKTRIGVIVSTKIEPSAVRRNRIRRRLSAAAKKTLPALSPDIPQLILFLGSPKTLTAEFKELQSEMLKVLSSS